MKERPILFSGPMVRAILDGKKTQTRRVVTSNYDIIGERNDGTHWPWREDCERGGDIWYPCPFGEVADRLWVRETFTESRDKASVLYRAWPMFDSTNVFDWKWTPSIFMPRRLSRITLEITGVRVERLQKITAADCIAEGVASRGIDKDGPNIASAIMYLADYETLWDSLNAKRGYGWDVNPWVWVIEFKRVQS